MSVFLFIIGALLCVTGLFLVGFFIPNREFSIGATFITTGSTAIVGGLALVGLGAVTRELRKMSKALERSMQSAQLARPQAAPTLRPAPVPPRAMPRPAAAAPRAPRPEPRFEETPAPEPAPASAPTIADATAERTKHGLFASIRGRSAAAPRLDPAPPPVPQPPRNDPQHTPRSDTPEPGRMEREPEQNGEDGTAARSSSLSALAARTAARLDLPRSVPELPRVSPERIAPEPVVSERPSEKPARNMFDTVWPTGSKSPEDDVDSDRQDESAAADAADSRPPEILKSGVIDGMAYTLYTDGSIEAQLPQGTLRFASIDDLRAHLERN